MFSAGFSYGRLLGWTALVVTPFGCAVVGPANPALKADSTELKAERLRMASEPVPLERPVVILSGYRAVPSMTARLRDRTLGMTSQNPEDFLAISYMFGSDIHTLSDRAIDQVQERWPSESEHETIEVDVLAISMGGLVGRLAALPPEHRPPRPDGREQQQPRRLKVVRLFTFGTPHQGAKLAEYIAFDNASRAMRPGSDFLDALNQAQGLGGYELIPYANLNDTWVGATRAAPPGTDPIWDQGRAVFSHFLVSDNMVFIVDTARRLRGEEPLIDARTPPPTD